MDANNPLPEPLAKAVDKYASTYHPLAEVIGIPMTRLIANLVTASIVALYIKQITVEGEAV
jgi:hypothetical protein